MAKDATGREGLSAGAIAKALELKPAQVKKAIAELGLEADFVKSGCSYFYSERVDEIKSAVG